MARLPGRIPYSRSRACPAIFVSLRDLAAYFRFPEVAMPVPRLNRSQIARLKRLLDMPYTPAEISREIGISVDALYRTHIPAGVPVFIDDKQRIWINGLAYREWVRNNLAARRRNKKSMGENAAYCLRCNAIVNITDVKVIPYRRGVRQMSGRCPICGGRVNRFLRAEGERDD